MTTLRALIFNLGVYFWTTAVGMTGLPVMVLPRRFVVPFCRFWAAGLLTWLRLTVGLTHEIIGRENLPSGPYILAVKHQSAWDTLILNVLIHDPAIVCKRELLWVPVLGWYLAKSGVIAIDRDSGARALKLLLTRSRAVVAEGRPIAIFPEGTRAPVGVTLPFQAGVGALYGLLDVPIVPVALNSGLFWGRRAFLKLPGRITVDIRPVIPPGLNRRVAMARLEAEIRTATDRLVAQHHDIAAAATAKPDGTETG
ncbi:MAG TPA: lysophospholipid acyltransferase family protein [Stellaceae bacterium]|nr:lysophospholipid acyltransferase family protein [Stellaceae bacterium]